MLGDDGVGWRIADEVEARLAVEPELSAGLVVDVERLGVGGLRLMEYLEGYDVAILADAARFEDRPVGDVRASPFDQLESHAAGHLDSAHDASLATALDLGRRLGARLPSAIETVTVQIHVNDEFGEKLSPEVEAAVPAAVEAVLQLLKAVR